MMPATEPLPPDTPVAGHALDLVEALDTEQRLLGDLVQVLRRQRDGIAGNDLPTLDDSVFSAQRILLNLQMARRRRRSLVQLLGGHPGTPLGELELSLGRAATPPIVEARDRLLQAARAVAQESQLNRRVLDGALATGHKVISLLQGGGQSAGLYRPEKVDESPGGSGALINTRI